MKQLDMKTGEIVDVPYVPKSDIVVVFEPNRPSYEIKKVKP